MKIRAQKAGYNTDLEFDDFVLKEFSHDKEKFVPNTELSCCECFEREDVANHQDSPRSFLVKFKADNLSNPQSIRPGVKGFILPENDYQFSFQSVSSNFTSVKNNHYNMELDTVKIDYLARLLHKNPKHLIDISQSNVIDYLTNSCQQGEWLALYAIPKKSNWKKYLKTKLKEKYKSSYGGFVEAEIKAAMAIDKTGTLELIKLLRSYDCLNPNEMKLINQYVL